MVAGVLSGASLVPNPYSTHQWVMSVSLEKSTFRSLLKGVGSVTGVP